MSIVAMLSVPHVFLPDSLSSEKRLVLPAASRMLHLLTTGPTMGMGRQCLCLFSRDAWCVSLRAPCQGRKYRYAQLTGFVCGGASARRHYAVKEGDHLTLLNVYAGFEAAKRNAQWSAARLVNHRSMRNACETRKQLVNYISKLGVPLESCGRNATALRRTITAAFFCNAAKLESSGSYRTIRGQQQVFVHPFSVLHQHPSPWVIFHELTVSTKPYILGVLQIEPQWLSELAPHFYQFKGTSPHNGAGRGAEQGENTLGVRKQARHI